MLLICVIAFFPQGILGALIVKTILHMQKPRHKDSEIASYMVGQSFELGSVCLFCVVLQNDAYHPSSSPEGMWLFNEFFMLSKKPLTSKPIALSLRQWQTPILTRED